MNKSEILNKIRREKNQEKNKNPLSQIFLLFSAEKITSINIFHSNRPTASTTLFILF